MKQPREQLKLAVLMGGTSNERAVSLSTGKMICESLDPKKYLVQAIDTREMHLLASNTPPAQITVGEGEAQTQALTEAHETGAKIRPDVVFIALHGKGGEDGTIQGMLETLGIPYTGSGVLASALAMNKRMAKRLFRSAGVPVVEDIEVYRKRPLSEAELLSEAQRVFGDAPLFVKPSAEGSTFGCSLVTERETLPQAVAIALQYDECVLVERYIRGMEVTAGVLEAPEEEDGLLALPLVEIIPKGVFYDYESKYSPGGSEHVIPARLSEKTTQRAQALAKQCHALLGCRGMSRADFLATPDETLYLLEVNTIPGMTPTSLLPQAAEAAGIPFSELLDRIVASALSHA